jgi:PAS domain S-box-containing protein
MATILVIDDEKGVRMAATLALRKAGHSVLEATNSAEGLKVAMTKVPDLIISDIYMKGGDGIALLKEIRASERTATIPFIFMSGQADHTTMLAGAEQAADGILPKPFTVHTLLTAVAKRLSREGLARQRHKDLRAQLLKILEGAPDLVALVEPVSGQFLFLNVTGRKLLGYTAEADISEVRLDTVHTPDKIDELHSVILPAVLAQREWAGETTFKRTCGEPFSVRAYVQAHCDHDGHCEYLSVIAHDLSESRRLEDERKVMELQLTQAHKLESIGQLSAGIAHEINTPTQYIGDNTRFLQEAFASLDTLLPKYDDLLNAAKSGAVTNELIAEVEQAAAKADLAFIRAEIPLAIEQSLEGVDRVTKIVRAMKDFSHPGVNEKTPIDLNHAIESTVTVARNEWKYVANLELDLDKTLPLVPCLPGEINQLVLNLVVNAAHAIEEVVKKFPDTKGTIVVRTRRNQEHVEILVSDTGAGIPLSIRKKIFDPFFTTKEVGKGTGQGLAIARSVMRKHGGAISFDSEVGRGTTFTVRLPLSPETK